MPTSERVATHHFVGFRARTVHSTHEDRCADCGASVWLSAEERTYIKRHREWEILCYICARGDGPRQR